MGDLNQLIGKSYIVTTASRPLNQADGATGIFALVLPAGLQTYDLIDFIEITTDQQNSVSLIDVGFATAAHIGAGAGALTPHSTSIGVGSGSAYTPVATAAYGTHTTGITLTGFTVIRSLYILAGSFQPILTLPNWSLQPGFGLAVRMTAGADGNFTVNCAFREQM